MSFRSHLFAAAAATLLCFAPAGASRADEFTPTQRDEIGRIVKQYLLANPEVLQEVIAELEKKQAHAAADRHRKAVKEHATLLFDSPRQVVVGNPKGNVTMVEFFDYNCGYCKRALADMQNLIQANPNLKVVLKEFPVLGEGSVEAARVAVAVGMQDKTGKKYLAFHNKLLTARGQANRERAMAAAKEVGVDMARLEKDMGSAEVRQTLEESFKLAEALGVNGTPSYVIGTEVIVGAVGREGLQKQINNANCGKPTC